MDKFSFSSNDDIMPLLGMSRTVIVYDFDKFYSMTRFNYSQYIATIKDKYRLILKWRCVNLVVVYDFVDPIINILHRVEKYLDVVDEAKFGESWCGIGIPANSELLKIEYLLVQKFNIPADVISKIKKYQHV